MKIGLTSSVRLDKVNVLNMYLWQEALKMLVKKWKKTNEFDLRQIWIIFVNIATENRKENKKLHLKSLEVISP